MDQKLYDLREYFDKNGFTQDGIAERLGVKQSAVSPYLTGKRQFGKNSANKWADVFGFRPAWLITGEKPMFPDGDERNKPAADGSDNPSTTPKTETVVYEKVIESLSKENTNLRMKIFRLMELMAKHGIPCDDEACKL